MKSPYSEERPWGLFHVLHEADSHKIKKIVVYPGERLSLQYHRMRAEHWYCVQGSGIATVGDRQVKLRPGISIDILPNEKHRVACDPTSENLIFVEVQTGSYLGEDDIVRLEDDYDRS